MTRDVAAVITPSSEPIPGPDPGSCPKCGEWIKAGMLHECRPDGGTQLTQRADPMDELRSTYRDALDAAVTAQRDDLLEQLIDSIAVLAGGAPTLKDPPRG